MIVAGLILAFWLGCGVVGYGVTFAYFQGNWPRIAQETRGDTRSLAFFIASFGPIGLAAALIRCGLQYGLRFK